MLVLSPAKINLGLQVSAKRPDGFHNIETAFYPVGWADAVEALPAQRVRLHVTGLPVDCAEEDNYCVKAFRLLQKDFGLAGADIYLHKNVPMGAGLGGGSGNAAAALRAVIGAYNISVNEERLLHYAAILGSDCPFFIRATPAFAEGKGEILSPLPLSLSGYRLAIAYPCIHISTAEMYARIVPQSNRPDIRKILCQPVQTWKESLVNDFEPIAFAQFPILNWIKTLMYRSGALYSAMSGSGSAVFGIFNEIPAALKGDLKGCTFFSQSL